MNRRQCIFHEIRGVFQVFNYDNCHTLCSGEPIDLQGCNASSLHERQADQEI